MSPIHNNTVSLLNGKAIWMWQSQSAGLCVVKETNVFVISRVATYSDFLNTFHYKSEDRAWSWDWCDLLRYDMASLCGTQVVGCVREIGRTSLVSVLVLVLEIGCTSRSALMWALHSSAIHYNQSRLKIPRDRGLYQINSSPPSAAYMRQWIRWVLIKKMACRLYGAKPLSKPMLRYCQLDP